MRKNITKQRSHCSHYPISLDWAFSVFGSLVKSNSAKFGMMADWDPYAFSVAVWAYNFTFWQYDKDSFLWTRQHARHVRKRNLKAEKFCTIFARHLTTFCCRLKSWERSWWGWRLVRMLCGLFPQWLEQWKQWCWDAHYLQELAIMRIHWKWQFASKTHQLVPLLHSGSEAQAKLYT